MLVVVGLRMAAGLVAARAWLRRASALAPTTDLDVAWMHALLVRKELSLQSFSISAANM